MRLKGRQARFVLGAVGGWVAARALVVWSGGTALGLGMIASTVLVAPHPPPWPRASPWPSFSAARSAAIGRGASPASVASARRSWPASLPAPRSLRVALVPPPAIPPPTTLRHASFAAHAGPADAAPFVPPPGPSATAPSRWTGSVTTFVRPGSGRASLAAGGQLGGSQAAARIAYRLNAHGPVRAALAARVYAPLASRGAEAAAGLDWYPLPGVPLRVSVERRVALDAAGRDAWSAYTAGGFYRELDRAVVIDGYAQAGVVGARSRDLFVDGALRAGRRWPLGRAALTLGAGLWGAAQPGVARLDMGPRLAVTLPVARHGLSAAIEGRLRIAGRASPGSGAALTIGLDL